jgi:cobalamin biosynthesis Mg chelatase CobN
MKNLKKYFMGMVMLAVLLVFPTKAWGAGTMNVTVGTTDNASAGDTVTVRLIGSNNPGISTFAVKLAYDSDYLTYNSATWSSTLTSDSGNMQMITPTTENSQSVLNISSVMVGNYSNNETIVTLNFTAKRAYTTMPVTLTSREVTDTNYDPVTVTIVADATAGLTSQSQSSTTSQAASQTTQTTSQASSQTTSQSSSQSSSETASQSTSQSTSQSSSQTAGGNDSNSSVSENTESERAASSGTSGSKGSSASTGSKGVDKTPKTGTIDVRVALAAAIVVFLVIAGICIYVLGKKKERHTS